MTAIGPHAPVGGRLVFDELPEFQHREREYDICPGCGGEKAAASDLCRDCANEGQTFEEMLAGRLVRAFKAWRERIRG